MDVSPNALRKETVQVLKQVDEQIAQVKKYANQRGLLPAEVRDERGGWAMSPLLAAKAQCLHTLTLLNERR